MLGKNLIKAAAGNAAEAGYQVPQSLRFNSADSAYLSWTPASAGNRKTFTWSFWVKRSKLGSSHNFLDVNSGLAGTPRSYFQFNSSDTITCGINSTGSSWDGDITTTQVFRDVSSWYHIVLVIDTTQATSSNRMKLYVNGEQVTSLSTATYPSQNTDTPFNTTYTHWLGRSNNNLNYANFYLAEFHAVDGQALTPSDFGETDATTGVWKPKAYAGTYGTNGFYLPFSNNDSEVDLGISAIPYTSDQGWNRTSLLLNTNGVDADQNNTFLDSSTNNFTITRNGNTTQGRFSPFADGWSNYFDGTGDYLTAPNVTALNLYNTTNTVECWVYLNSLATTTQIYGTDFDGSDYTIWSIQSSTGYPFYLSRNGTSIFGSVGVEINKWNHIAWGRSGNTVSIWLNGVRIANGTITSEDAWGTALITIGRFNNESRFNGYLSSLRVVKGTDVYGVSNTTITVPTEPLTAIANTSLLTCQSNRFVDNSTNNFAITRNGDVKVTAFNPFTPTQDYSASINGGSGYFDGSGDYLTAADNAGLDLGTDNFTIHAWIYPTWSSPGSNEPIVAKGNSSATGTWQLDVQSTSVVRFAWNSSSSITSTGTITPNQWTHIAVVREGTGTDQTKIYINGVNDGTGTVSQDLTDTGLLKISRNRDNSTIFDGYISSLAIVRSAVWTTNFTPPTAPPTAITNTSLLLNFTNAGIVDASGKNDIETVGDAQVDTAVTKWGSSVKFDGTGDYLDVPSSNFFNFGTGDFTIEAWIYRLEADRSQMIFAVGNSDVTTGHGRFYVFSGNTLRYYNNGNITTSSTVLSLNTWHHVALVQESGSQTLYLDGVSVGTSTSGVAFGGNTLDVQIGSSPTTTTQRFNGYIEDLRVTKGLARYTGNFTVPDAPFAYDKSDINYKQWQPNNFSVTAGADNDSLVDTPTPYGTDTGAGGEVRGNYSTLNALDTGLTLANGNLYVTNGASHKIAKSTFQVPKTGKWYIELTTGNTTDNTHALGFGLCTPAASLSSSAANASGLWSMYRSATFYINRNGTAYSTAGTWSAGTIVQLAVDLDNNQAWMGFNNTWYDGSNGTTGDPSAGTDATFTSLPNELFVCAHAYDNNSNINFGQRPFSYTAPSGFKALCTQNLPTPTVVQGDDYFNTVLYTGTGSSQSITGVGFQPDWVWIKERSGAADHGLYDAVRGVQNQLESNTTTAETTESTGLTAFGSDGFTVGSLAQLNTNTDTYVAWNWNAGGSNATNTDGTITSTVRANPTAGFSIVSYTGTGSAATIGHGLGAAPAMIIGKSRDSALSWAVYHASLGATKLLTLDSTAAASTNSTAWNDTEPTASVFSLGTGTRMNTSGDANIAYCFAEVEGFSKFGSYTGNGSADGPFVYCGFRPAWVLIKNTSAAYSWYEYDNKNNSYNVAGACLFPDTSDALTTSSSYYIDIVSNGFKLRNNNARSNASGNVYIVMAFAENPFKYSLAR